MHSRDCERGWDVTLLFRWEDDFACRDRPTFSSRTLLEDTAAQPAPSGAFLLSVFTSCRFLGLLGQRSDEITGWGTAASGSGRPVMFSGPSVHDALRDVRPQRSVLGDPSQHVPSSAWGRLVRGWAQTL